MSNLQDYRQWHLDTSGASATQGVTIGATSSQLAISRFRHPGKEPRVQTQI